MAVGERSDGARGGIASSHVAPPTRSTLIILPSLPLKRHLRFLLGIVTVRAKESVVSYHSREIPFFPCLPVSRIEGLSSPYSQTRKRSHDFPATDLQPRRTRKFAPKCERASKLYDAQLLNATSAKIQVAETTATNVQLLKKSLTSSIDTRCYKKN